MSEPNTLLREILQTIGCPYLSDLHSNCRLMNSQMKKLIMDIPTGKYSLDAWKEAVSYITGEICSSGSIQEAKENLLHRVR